MVTLKKENKAEYMQLMHSLAGKLGTTQLGQDSDVVPDVWNVGTAVGLNQPKKGGGRLTSKELDDIVRSRRHPE